MPEVEKTRDQLREEYCAGLEALAQYLRTNTAAELPDIKNFTIYKYGKTSLTAAVKTLGSCEKEFTDWTVSFVKLFGPLKYGFYCSRETVCEKKVIGKKTVPLQPSYYIAEIPEHEEDEIEWECDAILGTEEKPIESKV